MSFGPPMVLPRPRARTVALVAVVLLTAGAVVLCGFWGWGWP